MAANSTGKEKEKETTVYTHLQQSGLDQHGLQLGMASRGVKTKLMAAYIIIT